MLLTKIELKGYKLHMFIASNEIEAAIKSLSTKKSQGPDGFMLNSTRSLKN
jgi:hypothetical protein